ncbi:MAG TPA: competence/damage-inducible protein A [Syntrophomonadaceae bacterium]|nr:competence/damage-inducible protein A [Syntrophomonadaceae bacterium]
MKKAYLISTGTELLLGTTVDTNSVYLSQQLGDMGVRIIGKATVGDNRSQLERAFSHGLETADVIISSGGLGPTFDDLTKTVASEIMGCKLELRKDEATRLREYFAHRQREMPEINIKQAMFPPEADVLKNPRGSAPGMYLWKNDKLMILLPGPPHEMQAMFADEVKPRLQRDLAPYLHRIIKRTIKILGPGESRVEEMLGDLMSNTQGCSMALLASGGEVHIKLTAEGENEQDSERLLNDLTEDIKGRLGRHIFGYDDETLPERISKLLVQQGKTLAVAESCTGGLLGSYITDIPGSSRYFWGGIISYSNEAKVHLLNVKPDTLDQYGAVSQQTATEMARGILQCSGADLGISITGIAGPDGGTEIKPVGLIYIGLAYGDECKVKELRFVGPRDAIRKLSVRSALDILRRHLEQ